MDDIYDDIENYNEVNLIEELRNENKDLKLKLEEYSSTLFQLQKTILQDFDKLNSEFKILEVNYSSLLKTAKAEIERKTLLINQLNLEKDNLVINAMKNTGRNILKHQKNFGNKVATNQNASQNKPNNMKGTTIVKDTQGDEYLRKSNEPEPHTLVESCSVSTAKTESVENISSKNNNEVKENIYKEMPKTKSRSPYEFNGNKQRDGKLTDRRKSKTSLRTDLNSGAKEGLDESSHELYEGMDKCRIKRNVEDAYEHRKRILEKLAQYHEIPTDNKNQESYRDRETHPTERRLKRSRGRSRERERYRGLKDDYSFRSDYKRQRILSSPPRNKYNRSKSRDYRHSERRDFRDIDHYTQYIKHRMNDAEAPKIKRRKTEAQLEDFYGGHNYNIDDEQNYNIDDEQNYNIDDGYYMSDQQMYANTVGHTTLQNKNDEGNFLLEHVKSTDPCCQSPDYDYYVDNPDQHIVKEIRQTAAVQLDDPRITSKKYVLHNQNGKTILSRSDCKEVNIIPIDKSVWQIERVGVPEALKSMPSSVPNDIEPFFNTRDKQNVNNNSSQISLTSRTYDSAGGEELSNISQNNLKLLLDDNDCHLSKKSVNMKRDTNEGQFATVDLLTTTKAYDKLKSKSSIGKGYCSNKDLENTQLDTYQCGANTRKTLDSKDVNNESENTPMNSKKGKLEQMTTTKSRDKLKSKFSHENKDNSTNKDLGNTHLDIRKFNKNTVNILGSKEGNKDSENIQRHSLKGLLEQMTTTQSRVNLKSKSSHDNKHYSTSKDLENAQLDTHQYERNTSKAVDYKEVSKESENTQKSSKRRQLEQMTTTKSHDKFKSKLSHNKDNSTRKDFENTHLDTCKDDKNTLETVENKKVNKESENMQRNTKKGQCEQITTTKSRDKLKSKLSNDKKDDSTTKDFENTQLGTCQYDKNAQKTLENKELKAINDLKITNESDRKDKLSTDSTKVDDCNESLNSRKQRKSELVNETKKYKTKTDIQKNTKSQKKVSETENDVIPICKDIKDGQKDDESKRNWADKIKSDIETKFKETKINKAKFTELFGDSNSLITPDDLGIPGTDSVPEKFAAFENTQDAVDLNLEEIQKLSLNTTISESTNTPLETIKNTDNNHRLQDISKNLAITYNAVPEIPVTDSATEKYIEIEKPQHAVDLNLEEIQNLRSNSSISKGTDIPLGNEKNTTNMSKNPTAIYNDVPGIPTTDSVPDKYTAFENIQGAVDLNLGELEKVRLNSSISENRDITLDNKNKTESSHRLEKDLSKNPAVTCYDVPGIPVTDSISEKCISFENIQNAVDLNLEELEKVHHTTYIPESTDTPLDNRNNTENNQRMEQDQSIDPAVTNNGSSAMPKIPILAIGNKNKTSDVTEDIENKATDLYVNLNSDVEVDNSVKTIIISTGVQPTHAKELTEDQPNAQIADVAKHDVLGYIKAVATSTPHKLLMSQPETNNSLIQNESTMTMISELNQGSNSCVSKTGTDEPDVKIFVKRRRKFKKPSWV